jgi:hypothetical protein
VREIGHGGGRYSRLVFVYEVATGKLLHRLEEHDWQVSQVAFSRDGHRSASLGDDVVVCDLELRGILRRRETVRIDVERVTAALRFFPTIGS